MKKLIVIVIIALTVISACITNPIPEEEWKQKCDFECIYRFIHMSTVSYSDISTCLNSCYAQYTEDYVR